jgi:hypothetical protein
MDYRLVGREIAEKLMRNARAGASGLTKRTASARERAVSTHPAINDDPLHPSVAAFVTALAQADAREAFRKMLDARGDDGIEP